MNGPNPTVNMRQRLLIGCLGALTPILANLLVVDLHTALKGADLLDGATYVVRVLALCAAACLVVYLNSDERRPIKLFQLGIFAPALITAMLNGTVAQQSQTAAGARRAQDQRALPQPGAYLPSVIGSAYAQPAPNAAPQAVGVKNCLAPRDPTTSQRILKGLIGLVPDNEWFVVVASLATRDSAISDASSVQGRYGGKFQALVCEPLGGTDTRYRVVVGEYLSYADATRLKVEAIAAGLPQETWVWSPSEMRKAIQ